MIASIKNLTGRAVGALWLRLRGGEDQLRFLSLAIVMEEAVAPRVLRYIVGLISLTVASFLVWSAVAEVNEVAKGSGVVVPNGYTQVVQHFEGGIIAEIAFREGDMVEKGQMLVRLDGQSVKNDLRQTKIRQVSLELQAARLQAFIRNDRPDLVVPSLEYASMIAKQQRIYTGMMMARNGEADILKAQLKQRMDKLLMLEQRRQVIERRVNIARDMHHRRQKLVDRGLTNQFEYLNGKDRLNEALVERSDVLGEISQARFEVTEFENRLTSLDAKYRDDANQELERIETEIEQNKQHIATLTDRVDRLQIRAPVDGIVKGVTVNTIGEIAAPGAVLMEVVPIGEQLVVEMRISSQDIGQVHKGQPVEIKVSSFDFARYGTIEGTVQSISATTFADEAKGTSYYLGRVALKQNHLGKDPMLNKILPGMEVESNIVTGSKTILAYLLKPIHTSLNSALSER